MATLRYRCTNFAECDLALGKVIVEIEEGDDVICPGCQTENSLSPVDPGPSLGKRVLIGAGGAGVVLVLAWVLWPSGPNPELVNSMLSDFFPHLPK